VIGQFLDWCQRAGFGNLEDIEPIHVALTPSIIRALRQRSSSTSPPSAPKFPAATHVEEYLMEIEPAMSRMFELLIWVMGGVDIQDLQRQSRALELEKLNLARWRNDSPDVKEWIESETKIVNQMISEFTLERLQSGAEAKSLAAGSVAAGIIFMAYHGIEVGERHGSPVEGREVRPDYKLKKFVRLARNHAAHYTQKIGASGTVERARFQIAVLEYDQRATGGFTNYSLKLLQILGWESWENVRRDLLSLFDLTGESARPDTRR
jgi:hypothetical protein